MFEDPTFWVLVSFVIFVALSWWKARGKILEALDGRVRRVQAELDEVRELKNQAQQALAEQSKHTQAMESEARALMEQAKAEAVGQAEIAREKLERAMETRREQAMQRIAQAEASAIREIADRTTDLSIEASRKILRQQMDGSVGAQNIDTAIKDVSDLMKRTA